MAGKHDAGDGEEAGVKAPAKSKKLLIIIVAAAVVLALGGGGAYFYISKQRAAANAAEEGDEGAPTKVEHAKPKAAPIYLPLDPPLVVNLADPGGERVAQIGISLEVADAHTVDAVKAFLPTIRSSILMLISQRTAEELLSQDGKKKLVQDILREASIPLGGGLEPTSQVGTASKTMKKKGKSPASEHAEFPLLGVSFTSFIVQ